MEILKKFPIFAKITPSMIESTPKLHQDNIPKAVQLLGDPTLIPLFRKIEQGYLYWDKVKYLSPAEILPEVLWHSVKLSRTLQMKTLKFGDFTFHFTITERMLALLHHFDMNFGGSLSSEGLVSPNDRKYVLNSSIMEEAIASSQMEGANTTRKVAKEMLRGGLSPKNRSERMILNNYNTIRFISEKSKEDFSKELILRLHKMISNATLDAVEDEGRFRDNNDILVINAINGEIAHIPPSFESVNTMLDDLCNFANHNDDEIFVHPIVKSIIIHFIFAFIHPFCDGNGRTARSLVYWYLLKNEYWLVEYLSISRVIYRSKPKYERAFLCTEHDDFDLSYFILYNLEVMKEAFDELKEYLNRKIHERAAMDVYMSLPGITHRQAEIIQLINDEPEPETILTTKLVASRFGLNPKSIRNDLRQLASIGLITEIPINGREFGYIKSHEFEVCIDRLKEKQQGKNTEK